MSNDTVKIGQVWADNDARSVGRTVKVIDIDHPQAPGLRYALVETVTDPTDYPPEKPRIGKRSRIRLDRFRPTSTGYRLVEEA